MKLVKCKRLNLYDTHQQTILIITIKQLHKQDKKYHRLFLYKHPSGGNSNGLVHRPIVVRFPVSVT